MHAPPRFVRFVVALGALTLAACSQPAEVLSVKAAAVRSAEGKRVTVTGQLAFPERGATVSRGKVALRLHADAQFAEPSLFLELPVGSGADTIDTPPATFVVAGVKGHRHDGAAFTSADRVTVTGVVRFRPFDGEKPLPVLEDVTRIDAP